MHVNLNEMERKVPNLTNYKNFMSLCIDFKKEEMRRKSPIRDDKERYYVARNICVSNWKKNSDQINQMMDRITKSNQCYQKCNQSIKKNLGMSLETWF